MRVFVGTLGKPHPLLFSVFLVAACREPEPFAAVFSFVEWAFEKNQAHRRKQNGREALERVFGKRLELPNDDP